MAHLAPVPVEGAERPERGPGSGQDGLGTSTKPTASTNFALTAAALDKARQVSERHLENGCSAAQSRAAPNSRSGKHETAGHLRRP